MALLAAFACSLTQRLSEADRRRIQTVVIAPEIAVPAAIEFSDRRSPFDAFWAPVGAVVGAAPKPDPRARIGTDARTRGILIEDLVRSEFQKQLDDWGRFASGEPADATIVLSVMGYGLTASSGYEDDFVPVLRVSATMLDAQRRVIWRALGGIGAGDRTVGAVPLISLERDPSLLKKFWRSAAETVVAQLLNTLQER
jgi:hypothetical protein